MTKYVVQWGNLSSLRFWWGSFFTAAFTALLLGLIWYPLHYLFIPIWIAVMAGMLVTGTALHCPYCSKHIRNGADVCPRCLRHIHHTGDDSERRRDWTI